MYTLVSHANKLRIIICMIRYSRTKNVMWWNFINNLTLMKSKVFDIWIFDYLGAIKYRKKPQWINNYLLLTVSLFIVFSRLIRLNSFFLFIKCYYMEITGNCYHLVNFGLRKIDHIKRFLLNNSFTCSKSEVSFVLPLFLREEQFCKTMRRKCDVINAESFPSRLTSIRRRRREKRRKLPYFYINIYKKYILKIAIYIIYIKNIYNI